MRMRLSFNFFQVAWNVDDTSVRVGFVRARRP